MRVLLQNRESCLSSVAGDSIQVIKTKEYLDKIGIFTELSCSTDKELSSYDIIHLFNLIPIEETYRQFCKARDAGKKIVLSTVYWDPEEFLNYFKEEKLKDWWQETKSLREEVLAGVDLILPNSQMELNLLNQTFAKLPPAVVIPNAADSFFASASPQRFINRFKMKDFVLSVGRISPRKNHLNLIKAMKKLKLPLVLVGPINDGIYYQACRQEAAGSGVIFIDTLSQTELASAYAAAKVHALVSWYDTPGLVSLEAALAGCAIVSTDRGSTREYFESMAYYCDPGDIDSICQAIKSAWLAPKNQKLKDIVLQKYIWEKTAAKTVEAYRLVFGC